LVYARPSNEALLILHLCEGVGKPSFTARRFFSDISLKGGLVDPRLRASNEHIPIVRVPRAGGRPSHPFHPSQATRCASAEDHHVGQRGSDPL